MLVVVCVVLFVWPLSVYAHVLCPHVKFVVVMSWLVVLCVRFCFFGFVVCVVCLCVLLRCFSYVAYCLCVMFP